MMSSLAIVLVLSGCLVDRALYEERSEFFTDDDGDGFSEAEGDCNDALLNVFPSAPESCDELDNDCNGEIDEEAVDGGPWFFDGDGDHYGDIDTTLTHCEMPGEGWILVGGDCDDADADIHPNQDELCDGVDEDCDGVVDNDALDSVTFYPDEDGDGYGDDSSPVDTCEDLKELLRDGGDCDDTRSDVNPEMTEICNDGLDNDCDGTANSCALEGTVEMPLYIEVYSTHEEDNFGTSAAVGDIDGDGINELLVGSSYAYNEDAGERLGAVNVFDTPITESMTRDEISMELVGEHERTSLGFNLLLTDLDTDGYVDLLVGAANTTVGGLDDAGALYHFYGPLTVGGVAPELADGMILAVEEEATFARIVRALGDVNGDGVEDFGAGSSLWDHGGEYNTGGFALITEIEPGTSDVDDVARAFIFADSKEYLGYSFDGVDANGDGLSDVLIGADRALRADGAAFLFEGDFVGEKHIDDADFYWHGEDKSFAGGSVANAGDLNQDGIDDLIIGAGWAAPRGTAYVVWGSTSLQSFGLADATFKIHGDRSANRQFGVMVDGIGDVNDDGIPDIAVGEGGYAPNDVYIYYGPFESGMSLYDKEDADIDFVGDNEEDTYYEFARRLGDIDGDEVSDYVVGSANNRDDAGSVYIIPGSGW